MGKCLVTRLSARVDNEELLKLGELRVGIRMLSNPTGNTQSILMQASDDIDVEIIGDGYFTDVTLVENKGKTLHVVKDTTTVFYVSNSNCKISFLNKYAIKNLILFSQGIIISFGIFKFPYPVPISTSGLIFP